MPGPHLQAALFCERVVEEKDGVLSVVRIIDTINVQVSGPGVPAQMPRIRHKLFALIAMKSGDFQGSVTVHLEQVDPEQKRRWKGPDMPATLRGGAAGQNLILEMQLEFDTPGTHWFDVLVDGRSVTRMPLTVNYATVA